MRGKRAVKDGGGGEYLAVARLLRPWGLEGALVVESLTDDAGRFARLGEVWLSDSRGRVPARVTASRSRGVQTLLWLDRASNRDEALALVGATVEVRADQAEPPPPGSYYRHDLIGLRVVTTGGEELGHISSILETGAADVLVVGGDTAGEVLLPATRAVIASVDLGAGVMTVDPPQGLVEVNRRKRTETG